MTTITAKMIDEAARAIDPAAFETDAVGIFMRPAIVREEVRDKASIAITAALAAQPPSSVSEPGWEWAVVEVFGHRRHAGRVRATERFGTQMVHIDVPVDGDPDNKGWETHFYPGSALFSIMPTTEQRVMKENAPYNPMGRRYVELIPDLSALSEADEEESSLHLDDGQQGR